MIIFTVDDILGFIVLGLFIVGLFIYVISKFVSDIRNKIKAKFKKK